MVTEAAERKLWSLQYCLVLFATFSANITMTMLMPVLPIYIKNLGQGSTFSGFIVGIFTFAALLCRPFFGKLLDIYSKKNVLIAGGLIIAASSLFYSLVSNIAVLLVLRIFHGIGYCASTNATSTITADLVPPSRRIEGIGYYGAVFAVSLAIGPTLALAVFHIADINAVFYTAFGIAIAGYAAELFVISPAPSKNNPSGAVAGKASMLEKSAYPASAIMLAVSFAYIAIMSFLPSYGMALGLGSMSIFFLWYAAALSLSRILAGKYTGKHDVKKFIAPGIIFMGVAFLLLSFADSMVVFILAAIFFGFGYGMVQPTLNTVVIAGCDFRRRGAANATFFASMDVGLGVGAIIWGFVSENYGYSVVYGCCAVTMVVAYACYSKIR